MNVEKSINGEQQMNEKYNFTDEEAQFAFERFEDWLSVAGFDGLTASMYMLMYEDDNFFHFKNIITRNYITVDKKPIEFNK